jgi:DNA repair protein RadA/Sms
LRLLCHDDIDEAFSVAAEARFVVVDSVQALRSADVGGWPGTISQVRAVTQRCIDFAKERNVPVVLVGHIT